MFLFKHEDGVKLYYFILPGSFLRLTSEGKLRGTSLTENHREFTKFCTSR
jgi:hypothetical protein